MAEIHMRILIVYISLNMEPEASCNDLSGEKPFKDKKEKINKKASYLMKVELANGLWTWSDLSSQEIFKKSSRIEWV